MGRPRQLLKLAECNPIVNVFLQYWKSGSLDWDSVLVKIAETLEKECRRLADEFELRDEIVGNKNDYPVLQKSLIPDLLPENRLERQSILIDTILRIDYFYIKLLTRCESRTRTDILIINTPVLVTGLDQKISMTFLDDRSNRSDDLPSTTDS